MATESLLGEFCEETTCSICPEYFKDPVILDCGHNFCQACLTQCWEESERAPSCPQCREIFQQENCRPNRQLANLVELVKKLQVEKRAERKWRVCEQHQEALKLFCKEDQTPICWLCDRSKEHKDHNTVLLDEAAQEYKERIKARRGSLEKERDNLVVWKLAEEQGSQKCLITWGAVKRTTNKAQGILRAATQEETPENLCAAIFAVITANSTLMLCVLLCFLPLTAC